MNKVILVLFLVMLVGSSSCEHDIPVIIDDGGVVVEECDTTDTSFGNVIFPIISTNCASTGCHDAATATEGVILDSYDNIIMHGEVDDTDPLSVDLYKVLIHPDPQKLMPPENQLDNCSIALIGLWIEQGAPNN